MTKAIAKAIGALCVFALACGCGAQTVTLSGTGTLPPTPAITVTPQALSFGSVYLNQPATQSIAVNSTGSANLQVTAITISGPEFALTNPPALPLTLAPGTGTSLSVAFDPTVVGNATGALSITSNATTSPVASVSISGSVTTQTYQANLSWQAPAASADPVVGYNVYRAPHGSAIYTQINTSLVLATAYADTAVVSGLSYDYVVKSVDGNGNLSLPSNVWTAVIP